MKKIIIALSFILMNAVFQAQCTTKFLKMMKVEEVAVKNDYGDATGEIEVNVYFSNGKKSWLRGWDKDQVEAGQYVVAQLNASKNVAYSVGFDNGFYDIIVTAKYTTDNKYLEDADWYVDGEEHGMWMMFPVNEGWSFSGIVGDYLVMTQDGAKHWYTHAKTENSNCKLYIKEEY